MINKRALAYYMKYIIKTYSDGCASYNWLNRYEDILQGIRLPEEYENECIIEDCLSEFSEDIGLCGCGNPESTNEVLRQILNIKSADCTYEDRQKAYGELCNSDMNNDMYYGLIQFVLYVLDNKEFLEHGGGIGGAWLTEKGRIYLDLLNAYSDIVNSEQED